MMVTNAPNNLMADLVIVPHVTILAMPCLGMIRTCDPMIRSALTSTASGYGSHNFYSFPPAIKD
jgi:hypothetical protein